MKHTDNPWAKAVLFYEVLVEGVCEKRPDNVIITER